VLDGLGAAGIGLAALPLLLRGSRAGALAGVAAGRRARTGRDAGATAARRDAARLGVVTAAAWAAAALVGLWLEAAEAAAVPPARLGLPVVAEYATAVAAGRGLLLTIGCALAVAALRTVEAGRATDPASRLPEFALGLLLLGALAGPVTGHAGGQPDRDPAVLAIALHVVAASVWAGGLLGLALVLARRPGQLRVALPRYSTVAGYCVAVVLASGTLSAALRLPAPAALWGTGYGRLVLVKAVAAAVLVGLGWQARRRMPSRLAGLTGAGDRAPIVRWVGVELVVMAGVFVVAAALAGSTPT
jgi:putative copper resistance protein D